jgi:hypothetical protein
LKQFELERFELWQVHTPMISEANAASVMRELERGGYIRIVGNILSVSPKAALQLLLELLEAFETFDGGAIKDKMFAGEHGC